MVALLIPFFLSYFLFSNICLLAGSASQYKCRLHSAFGSISRHDFWIYFSWEWCGGKLALLLKPNHNSKIEHHKWLKWLKHKYTGCAVLVSKGWWYTSSESKAYFFRVRFAFSARPFHAFKSRIHCQGHYLSPFISPCNWRCLEIWPR